VALALTRIPENWGNLYPASKFVQWRTALAAVALQVFSLGNIVCCAPVIPEIFTCSKTGDGRNTQSIVHSYIAVATWNDAYNK